MRTKINLTTAEIQSGLNRQRAAENLILQLPTDHDGRNMWLLNYGVGEQAIALRRSMLGAAFADLNPSSGAINPPYVLDDFDPVAMVEEFHRHFGIEYDGKPRMLDFEIAQFRLKFLREEVGEYEKHDDAARFELRQRGMFAPDESTLVHELAAMLDALVDTVYVVLGTAHLQGFNFREAFRRVHAANMRKVKNTNAATPQEAIKLKISKPPGWRAPSHLDLVRDNAHEGGEVNVGTYIDEHTDDGH